MRTSMRTIMHARANQRKRSLLIQEFKCQEIEHKQYLADKKELERLKSDHGFSSLEEHLDGSLEKKVKDYEKKHNIKEVPKKIAVEKKGFMNKVRSLFSKGKK